MGDSPFGSTTLETNKPATDLLRDPVKAKEQLVPKTPLSDSETKVSTPPPATPAVEGRASIGNVSDEMRMAMELQNLLNIKTADGIKPFMAALKASGGWKKIEQMMQNATAGITDQMTIEAIKNGICRCAARALFPYAATFKKVSEFNTEVRPNIKAFKDKEKQELCLSELDKLSQNISDLHEEASSKGRFAQAISVLTRATQASIDASRALVQHGKQTSPINSVMVNIDFTEELLKTKDGEKDKLRSLLFKIYTEKYGVNLIRDLPQFLSAYETEKRKIATAQKTITLLESSLRGSPKDRQTALRALKEHYESLNQKEQDAVKKLQLKSKIDKIEKTLFSENEDEIVDFISESASGVAWDSFEWSGKSVGVGFETGKTQIKNFDKYGALFAQFLPQYLDGLECSPDEVLEVLPAFKKVLADLNIKLSPTERQKLQAIVSNMESMTKSVQTLASIGQSLKQLFGSDAKNLRKDTEFLKGHLVLYKGQIDEVLQALPPEAAAKFKTTEVYKAFQHISDLKATKVQQEDEKDVLENEHTLLDKLSISMSEVNFAEDSVQASKKLEAIKTQVSQAQQLEGGQAVCSTPGGALTQAHTSKESQDTLVGQRKFLGEIEKQIGLIGANQREISKSLAAISTLESERQKLSGWSWLPWNKDHARRNEINQQVKNQKARIADLEATNKALTKEIDASCKNKAKEYRSLADSKTKAVTAKDKEISKTAETIAAAQETLQKQAKTHLQELSTFVAEIRTTAIPISTTAVAVPKPTDLTRSAVVKPTQPKVAQVGPLSQSMKPPVSRPPSGPHAPSHPAPQPHSDLTKEPKSTLSDAETAALRADINQVIAVVKKANIALQGREGVSTLDRGIILDAANKALDYLKNNPSFEKEAVELRMATQQFQASVKEYEKVQMMPNSSGYIANILQTEAAKPKPSGQFVMAAAGGTVGFVLAGPLGAIIGAGVPLLAQAAQKLFASKPVEKAPVLNPPPQLPPARPLAASQPGQRRLPATPSPGGPLAASQGSQSAPRSTPKPPPRSLSASMPPPKLELPTSSRFFNQGQGPSSRETSDMGPAMTGPST